MILKIAFIALGMILIVLFLMWILFVRPGSGEKWIVLVFDAILVMASIAVLGMGFGMRGRYIEAHSAEAGQESAEGGNREEGAVSH